MNLTLFEKKQETEDVYSFIFKPEKKIVWRAGQYMFYTLPNKNPDSRGVTRYFTMSSAPFEKDIVITTRISLPRLPRLAAKRAAGKAGLPSSTFKKSLVNMKIGEIIEASGPDGDFTVEDPNKTYVFIAGGIGITPFRSILLDLDHKKLPVSVQLLYANRDKDIVFKAELESLTEKNKNFKISYFISPNRISDKILSSIINHKSSIINPPSFYISGPSPFIRSVLEFLKENEVPSENIKLDHFPGYQNF